MRRFLLPCLMLALGALALAAPAQAQGLPAGTNLSWEALDPGDDWSARVIRSVFPVTAATGGEDNIGAAGTVIGVLVGGITGFVAAVAMVWVVYSTLMQIFRGAESGRLLSSNMSAMFLVRMGVAAILMFPLPSGFSAGQAIVVKASLTGAGLGKYIYGIVIKGIGPDAMVVAQPIIPGTKTIVAGLIQNEMCRALANAATGQPNMVPAPVPTVGVAYVTYAYKLSPGNGMGGVTCGTVSLRTEKTGLDTNIAGITVDMTGMQRETLDAVLSGSIRPGVEAVANRLWMTKEVTSLAPLMGILQRATDDYTRRLTNAAQTKTAELRGALQDATQARNGNVGLIANQVQLSSLGWTQAGAYYLEFARLSGTTMSLVSATPTVNTPNYEGLGRSLSSDFAPPMRATIEFMTRLMTHAQTTDGMNAPSGYADVFQGATPGEDGAGAMEKLFRALKLSDRLLSLFTEGMSPQGNMWTDPFSALIQLGHSMTTIALTALGTAGLLNSNTGTAAVAAWNALTLNAPGVGATLVGSALMNFMATPIFMGLMGILVPGLTIAFVLPMIPWVMWIAGVAGWLILVCEAVIVLPLWMLAHMTYHGEGMHGRAQEGYALMFNVVMRPTFMLAGLFLGYVIFAAMSWLIRMGFGIAAGFVLANGWVVTNVIGVVVLLCIFVLIQIVAATLSFRMISLIPHHAPKLLGFSAGGRVDMDQFGRDAAMVGGIQSLRTIQASLAAGAQGGDRDNRMGHTPPPSLPAPGNGSTPPSGGGRQGMDPTLRASNDTPPQSPPPAPREERGNG